MIQHPDDDEEDVFARPDTQVSMERRTPGSSPGTDSRVTKPLIYNSPTV
jgi:hypothetical protein